MADEAAVAVEPQTIAAPEVEEVSPAPQEAGEAAPAEDAGSVLRDFFRQHVTSPEEFAAALEEVPEEFRTPIMQEWERRGEQRSRTRKQETDTARDGRLGTWKPYADNYANAEAFLQSAIRRANAGDLDALSNVQVLAKAMDDYRNGAVGKVILENEAYVPDLIDTLLPDLTPEEQQKLDKPLYEFGRTGIASKVVPLAVELAQERARKAGYDEGFKKGQQDRAAKAVLAEKLTKLEEVRKQAAGLPVNGRAVTVEDERAQIQREISQFDPTGMSVTEGMKQLNDLRQRLNALG